MWWETVLTWLPPIRSTRPSRQARSPRRVSGSSFTNRPEVDAVVQLGLGIQAASGQLMRSGPFYPDHGLERMVAFHTSQDARYAEAAKEASERHDVPLLVCTEHVNTDRHYGNSGPVTVKQGGRLCYPSAHRAIRALRALVDYAEYRASLEAS